LNIGNLDKIFYAAKEGDYQQVVEFAKAEPAMINAKDRYGMNEILLEIQWFCCWNEIVLEIRMRLYWR
jgi:hypothetical protein